MIEEIIYTSAPKGLKPGSRGFCTVVSTQGMARNVAERLESLSGYRHAYGLHDANAQFNPVNWSHLTLRVAGRELHILSRIADAGQDYSGRSNKLAHHLALESGDCDPTGPARVLAGSAVVDEWDNEVKLVAARKLNAVSPALTAECDLWKTMTGDAGWAGVVAEHVRDQRTPISIIIPNKSQFPRNSDALDLVKGVLDLLPAARRWDVTFSTYFTKLAPGTQCQLRFVLDGTSESVTLRNDRRAQVIDLASDLPLADGGELVDNARIGKLPLVATPSPASRVKSRPVAPSLEDSDDEFAPDSSADSEVEFDEDDSSETYSLQRRAAEAIPKSQRKRRKSRQDTPALPASPFPKANSNRKWIVIGISVSIVMLAGISTGAYFAFKAFSGEPANTLAHADRNPEYVVPGVELQITPQKVKSTNRNDNDVNIDANNTHRLIKPDPRTDDKTDASNQDSNQKTVAAANPVDGNTKTNPANATAPQPQEQPKREKKPNPFSGINDGKLVSFPREFSETPYLIRCKIEDPDSLSVKLLRNPLLERGYGISCEASNKQWKVILSRPSKKPSTIGVFRYIQDAETTGLQFTANEEGYTFNPAAAMLPFSVLEVSADGYDSRIALCQPAFVEPLSIRFEDERHHNGTVRIEIDPTIARTLRTRDSSLRIEANPSPELAKLFDKMNLSELKIGESIVAVVLVKSKEFPGVEAHLTISPIIDRDGVEFSYQLQVRPRTLTTEGMKELSKQLNSGIQIAWSSEIRTLLNPPKLLGLTKSEVNRHLSKTNAEKVAAGFADLIERHNQRLTTLRSKLGDADPDVTNRARADIKLLKEQIGDLEREAKKYSASSFSKMRESLTQIRQTIATSPIGFSIVAEVDGYKSILVTTDESK
jgi:hypothetical protein